MSCRLCTNNLSDLIQPCSCGFIHRDCLNVERSNSMNHTACPHCYEPYEFDILITEKTKCNCLSDNFIVNAKIFGDLFLIGLQSREVLIS